MFINVTLCFSAAELSYQSTVWQTSACLWLCQCWLEPCMWSGWGVMGETKALFVPLSCISAHVAWCGGRPLTAEEPRGGSENWGLDRKGAARPTVTSGGWRAGCIVVMATWLRKVGGLDVVWQMLLLWTSLLVDDLARAWMLNKLMWEWGERK